LTNFILYTKSKVTMHQKYLNGEIEHFLNKQTIIHFIKSLTTAIANYNPTLIYEEHRNKTTALYLAIFVYLKLWDYK
jgi:hypothetical protein